MVNRVEFQRITGTVSPRPTGLDRASSAGEFSRILEKELQSTPKVRFSAHALGRLADGGFKLTDADRLRLERAVGLLSAKGARESLVIMDRFALLVSVRNRTVITVVPFDDVHDGLFTNIDSAAVVSGKDTLPPLE